MLIKIQAEGSKVMLNLSEQLKRLFLTVLISTCVFGNSGCATGKFQLIKAAKKGNCLAAHKLINEGVNVNESDEDGATPLMHAIWYDRSEMVRLLVSNGADLSVKDESGRTPLMHAIWFRRTEMAKFLIDNGADLSAKDCFGRTPLRYALACKLIDTVALIRTKYQEDDINFLWFNEALKAPSRYSPEQGTYLIPPGSERAYANAISDCNYLITGNKKG